MTHNHDFRFGRLSAAALVVAAATMGSAACSTNAEEIEGSGETHFLAKCNSDAACGAGLSCLCGICTTPCDADAACAEWGGTCSATCSGTQTVCDRDCSGDADCTGLGEDYECDSGSCRHAPPPTVPAGGSGGQGGGGGTGGANPSGCGAGCTAVLGYSVDGGVGCAHMDEKLDTGACVCGFAAEGPLGCHQRLDDGTAWLFHEVALADPSAWGECTDAQQTAARTSCEFDGCAYPPSSTCSVEDFCTAGKCGGVLYDETGCRRAPCGSDADCSATGRCTAIDCGDNSHCFYSPEGTCQCETPLMCVYEDRCVPTTIAGPKGDWTRLDVDLGTGPCAEPDCGSTWSFSPMGALDAVKQGAVTVGRLAPTELEELDRMIDGPELRSALRDGIACEAPPTDVGVTITLVLSTEELTRNVTGCAISGPEGNIFQRVYQFAQQF